MPKRHVIAATLILGLSQILTSQSATAEPDLAAICAERACREGGQDIILRLNDRHFTTIPTQRTPFILNDGGIVLFPGEAFAVQFVVENDQLVRPRFVRRFVPRSPVQVQKDGIPVANPVDATLPAIPVADHRVVFDDLPPNTVIFSYGQIDDKTDMLLTIDHNLPKRLKIAATMHVPTKDGYKPEATTTCPILPQLTLFEHWPYALGPILIRSPRQLKDSDDSACT